jgi:prepilin-type N-terminal cleavage/methylation domain-containing protein
MRRGAGHPSRGFTLIEIIVTLVIVAVMATMISVYFGKGFLGTATPVPQLQKFTDLHRAMENIRSAYQKYPKWRSGALYVAGNLVIPSNPNGRYYECKGGGSCGSSSPDIDDGSNWTDKGIFMTSSYLTALSTSIGVEGANQDNAYGKYNVVKNRLISPS